MSAVLVLMELIPDKILLLFDVSEQMLRIGIPAVRFMSLSFYIGTIGIIFAAVFQGFGNGSYSMYLAFSRQAILLAPLLLLGGMAETASFGMAVICHSGSDLHSVRNTAVQENRKKRKTSGNGI